MSKLLQNKFPKESIIVGDEFEEALGMVAYGAYLGSVLSHDDVSAVAALPDAVALA